MTEYIERKAVRDTLYDADAITMSGVKILNQFPGADVAPVRHGRWVKIYENGEPKVEQHQVGVFCSKCMNVPKDRFTESDYCPNCGAKMDGGAGNGC